MSVTDDEAGGRAGGAELWDELIFGIVKPVGVDRDRFILALTQQLKDFDYSVHHIRLSSILAEDYMADGVLDSATDAKRISALIAAGDQLCEQANKASAVALCGVNEINRLRNTESGSRVAYIVDSIKRVPEFYDLRAIYRDRYIQFGLKSSESNRRQFLTSKENPKAFSKTPGEIDAEISLLMERDLREPQEFGQNTMRAFPLSDVFIDMDDNVERQVARFVNLLFGSPKYDVPTAEEFGMQLAYISSTRSPELGLKVGAAIVGDDHRVVAMGVNAHPVDKQQSPDFDESTTDIRRLVLDTVTALAPSCFRSETREQLDADPEAFVVDLLKGPLQAARIRDLTEFQPTVHAEMSALLDAIRTQSSLSEVTMYVTAYPCHGCAKHLVDLRLPVVYLEPYPKSRAATMYASSVNQNFRAFCGVAPVRYQSVFAVREDRKLPDGTRLSWDVGERAKATPKVDYKVPVDLINDLETLAINALPVPGEFTVRVDGDLVGPDADVGSLRGRVDATMKSPATFLEIGTDV